MAKTHKISEPAAANIGTDNSNHLAAIVDKLEFSIALVDSIADMHLGNCTPSEWLQRLATLLGCNDAAAVSWGKGAPATVNFKFSGQPLDFPAQWFEDVEQIIEQVQPAKPDLLANIARRVNSDTKYKVTDRPELLIALLDTEPARTLLILQRDGAVSDLDWNEEDKELFRLLLPSLFKAHQVHKQLVLFGNRLDIANKVANATPRGIVVMTPDGAVVKTNSMADAILAENNGLYLTADNYFAIKDSRVNKQFRHQLELMDLAQLDDAETPIWNRSCIKSTGKGSYQLTLKSLPLDNWHIESNKHDRRAVIYVSSPENTTIPSAIQLKEFYDLTNAQARLVKKLMQGNDVITAAAKLHVSINTARSHLRAIYAKLGVESQVSLLRLLSATLVHYSVDAE